MQILQIPLARVRSAMYPIEMDIIAETAYGGTLSSCAFVDVYPCSYFSAVCEDGLERLGERRTISLITVGTNKENAYTDAPAPE